MFLGCSKAPAVASSIRSSPTSSTILRRLTAPPHSTALRSPRRHFSTTKPSHFINSSPRMVVHVVKGQSEFQEKVVDASQNNLVIVDCFATWCGPCKMIAPKLAQWSEEAAFSGVNFIKIDVDENSQIAQDLGIRAMPTFLLFKEGQKIDELVGADPTKLKELLEKHK